MFFFNGKNLEIIFLTLYISFFVYLASYSEFDTKIVGSTTSLQSQETNNSNRINAQSLGERESNQIGHEHPNTDIFNQINAQTSRTNFSNEIGIFWTQDNTECSGTPLTDPKNEQYKYKPYDNFVGCNNKDIILPNWRDQLESFKQKCKKNKIPREGGLPDADQPCYVGLNWYDGFSLLSLNRLNNPNLKPYAFKCMNYGNQILHYVPPFEKKSFWEMLKNELHNFALKVDEINNNNEFPIFDAILVSTGFEFETGYLKSGCEDDFKKGIGRFENNSLNIIPNKNNEVVKGWNDHMNIGMLKPGGWLYEAFKDIKTPVRVSLRWNYSSFTDVLAEKWPQKDGQYMGGFAAYEGTRCIYRDKESFSGSNYFIVEENPSKVIVSGTQYQALKLRKVGKWLTGEYGNQEDGTIQCNLDGWLWGAAYLLSGSQGNERSRIVQSDPYWGPFIRIHMGREPHEAPSAWVRLRGAAVLNDPYSSDCKYQNVTYYMYQTNRPNPDKDKDEDYYRRFSLNEKDIRINGNVDPPQHDLRNYTSQKNTVFKFKLMENFKDTHQDGGDWILAIHVMGANSKIIVKYFNGTTENKTMLTIPGNDSSKWYYIESELTNFHYNPDIQGNDLILESENLQEKLVIYLVQLIPPSSRRQ